MDPRTLSSGRPPSTPAWQELAGLLDRRRELTTGVDAIDTQQRAASEAATAAAADLANLERRGLGGETVTAEQRKRAEQALTRARARASEPWAERRAGATAAVADLDRRVQRFTHERFDDLVAGLSDEGREAAKAVDEAATRLLEAHAWREEIASRMSALASTIAPMRPGDVAFSRAEAAASQCGRLLDQGGEPPPELRHDPREPRHGQAAADEAVPA